MDTAQEALHTANWHLARTHFEAVLRDSESAEALDGLGLAHWWLNNIGAAHEFRTRAYLAYKARGDVRRAAWLAAWLAREQVFFRSNGSAMNGWFARAERLLADAAPCAERGWVSLYHATMTAPPAALEACAQNAAALARRFDDSALEALALANTGMARVALGRVADGMACVDEAMAAATSGEVHDIFVICETFCVTLSACELAGDSTRTDHWCQAASDYARRHNSPFLSAYCRTTYGGLLADSGRWHDAEAALTEAIRTFDGGHQGLRVHAVLKLADLRVSQGRLEEAEVLLSGYEDHGNSAAPLARLNLARGDAARARAILDQSLTHVPDAPALHRVPLLRLLVDVALAQADIPSAQSACAELTELAALSGSALLEAQADLARGQLASATDDDNAALHLRNALMRLQSHEQSLLAGRARLAMARTLRRSDPSGAAMWAHAALAGFERLGAARDRDDARSLLREMGEGGQASRAAVNSPGVSALTQREYEVLNLLTAGLSNREIAARLVISAKTVEHHVGQILSKLGLRNRAEAAAFAAARRPRDK